MYVCTCVHVVNENKMQRVYCVIHLFMHASCSIHVRQIGRGENFIF